MNEATKVWQERLQHCLVGYDYIVKPRGMEVREVVNGRYVMSMPAFIDLKARKVNLGFMLIEPWWILSGSNRLSDITPYLKGYANYSDDGVFMRGAYSPKVIDQLPWVVETFS